MKIHSYYQRQKCRPVILVSRNIGHMGIFAEVPREGRQTTVGLSRTLMFCVFGGYLFEKFRQDGLYTPCPEKKRPQFFLHYFNKCRHSFVIFGMNHPEDLFY